MLVQGMREWRGIRDVWWESPLMHCQGGMMYVNHTIIIFYIHVHTQGINIIIYQGLVPQDVSCSKG